MTRLPPQNLDAEKALLGSVLLDDRVIDDVAAIVAPEDFYDEKHAPIWLSVLEQRAERKPTDLVTIAEHLGATKRLGAAGGPLYLHESGGRQRAGPLFTSVPFGKSI